MVTVDLKLRKRKTRKMDEKYALSNRDFKKHVSGIKIIKKNGYWHEFIVGGETYSLSVFGRFTVSACILGYLCAKKKGSEMVKLSISMVWDLAGFVSTLKYDEDSINSSVREVLRRADELLVNGGIYSGAKVNSKSCVTFRLLGKNIDKFMVQIIYTLHMGL